MALGTRDRGAGRGRTGAPSSASANRPETRGCAPPGVATAQPRARRARTARDRSLDGAICAIGRRLRQPLDRVTRTQSACATRPADPPHPTPNTSSPSETTAAPRRTTTTLRLPGAPCRASSPATTPVTRGPTPRARLQPVSEPRSSSNTALRPPRSSKTFSASPALRETAQHRVPDRA